MYNVSWGGSGGSVSCTNHSRSQSAFTTFNGIAALGYNDITCTATSGTGKTASARGAVTLSQTFTPDNLGVTDGASKNSSEVTIPKGGRQYGPYVQLNVGCYRIFYYGSNLNASSSMYSAYNTSDGYYTIRQLGYVSADSHYYIKSGDTSGSGVEFVITNNSNSTVTVTRINVSYLDVSSRCDQAKIE